MDGNKQAALASLIQLSYKQGYILFDDIMNCADEYALSIQDVDWLSNAIATRGILVYDEMPITDAENNSDDSYDDFAQADYESIFDRVIELSPSLKPFIEDIRNVVPPQYKEVGQLKYQLLEGNQHARQRMIEMHLRIAVRISLQRAEAFDLDIEETLGNACVGLINAVDKYDPDTGGSFGSYAAYWIFLYISKEQGTQRPLIYYPVHWKEKYYKVYLDLKMHGCIECNDWVGCYKVNELVRQKLECSLEQAEEVICTCKPIDSLDEYIDKNSNFEGKDEINEEYERIFLTTENMLGNVSRNSLKKDVREVVGKLNRREREVVCARYGLDDGREKTLEEVGLMYGVTRERIRQLEKKAFRRIVRMSTGKQLKDYL